MGGVDKHDMLRQLYGTNRKSMKWWHRIFFGLLDMSIVNAYDVYKETHPSLSVFSFRTELARGLLTYTKDRKARGTPKRRKTEYSIPTSVRFTNTGVHWPKFTQKKGRYCKVPILNSYSICMNNCRKQVFPKDEENIILRFSLTRHPRSKC
ncbi:uncharacterized protein LOC119579664 [Penaeus monodon]|uniref:uncharacterized protein LOC119579664 n=1 Tax=Penaeus monodon TaxID=6687 RepID=UPI0018A75A7E|nr:uncharacterized protein LOC119579664 [Penaeus monodon]